MVARAGVLTGLRRREGRHGRQQFGRRQHWRQPDRRADRRTHQRRWGGLSAPITGRVDIEAWLAAGHYLKWTCQDGVQDKILISIHGKQRICSNALVTGHATKDEYPVDASSVKELYDEAGVNIVGYAVSRHVKAGTDGASWYWYKRVPADDPQMPDENGVVADGLGDEGVAMSLCVSCHSAAGNDADHPGHDFIYKVAE